MPERSPAPSRNQKASYSWLAFRIAFAGSAVAWCLSTGMTEIVAAPSVNMSRRLLQDATFTQNELEAASSAVGGLRNAGAATARAIIALRLYEMMSASPEPVTTVIEERRQDAEAAVREALVLAPGNGFLWYALFALKLQPDGTPDPATLPFLAKSYELAPWEGWVAIRRSPTLMPMRAHLPEELRKKAEAEFRVLLKQNILPPIQKVFATADPALRMEVLTHIEKLPTMERMRFIRGLSRELNGKVEG